MSTSDELTPERKLRIALDLADLGVKIMRENLRRQFPQAADEEIERRLIEWVQTRPGAEFGDAEVRPRMRVITPASHENRV